MADDEPRSEIVYDDPGSVTDIRKKFGAMTKPTFARPRAISGNSVNKGRPGSSRSNSFRDSFGSNRDSRGSIGDKSSPFASISQDWNQSHQINRPTPKIDFPKPPEFEKPTPFEKPALSPKPVQFTAPLTPQQILTPKPVFTPTFLPQTPLRSGSMNRPQRSSSQRKSSSSSGMFQFPVANQNTDIVQRIAALELNPEKIDSFEAAVRDFYKNVQLLDPTITDPNPAR